MMTAHDVAAAYGLPLRQKGTRHWACCPLHGEKTASLCFFPDGRWYCFGCHQHGDAADLYAALYGVPLAQALREVKGEQPTQARKATPEQLRRRVEEWMTQRWAEACTQKHAAARSMSEAHDTPAFWEALRLWAEAEDTLNALAASTPAQRVKMIAKERDV